MANKNRKSHKGIEFGSSLAMLETAQHNYRHSIVTVYDELDQEITLSVQN